MDQLALGLPLNAERQARTLQLALLKLHNPGMFLDLSLPGVEVMRSTTVFIYSFLLSYVTLAENSFFPLKHFVRFHSQHTFRKQVLVVDVLCSAQREQLGESGQLRCSLLSNLYFLSCGIRLSCSDNRVLIHTSEPSNRTLNKSTDSVT